MSEDVLYVDGTGLVLGRLASWLAQKIMAGERVVVVNSQDLIITGNKKFLIDDRLQDRARATHTNPRRGPFYPRFPDRILRRTVRGMLPWKKSKGREAYRRLSAYINIPEELTGKDFQTVPSAKGTGRSNYMTVGELSRAIGWQHGVTKE